MRKSCYIADRFWDVVRLDELGFPDDASDAAMAVASALESAAKGFPPSSISDMSMCSVEGIRAGVREGHPAEWFKDSC